MSRCTPLQTTRCTSYIPFSSSDVDKAYVENKIQGVSEEIRTLKSERERNMMRQMSEFRAMFLSHLSPVSNDDEDDDDGDPKC
jgi:hypothetical protein